MKNIFLYLLLFSVILTHDGEHSDDDSHDRANGGAPKIGLIYGEVVNAEDSEPVEYVSVSIYNNDSEKLVAGGITDSYGFFSIDEISPGDYFIMLEFIGYEVLLIENIKLNRTQGVKRNLGTLSLVPKAIQGSAINVEGEMPEIEFETDKMVYTPSNDILASSGSAEDVLNNVPMVLVDQDGAVSLKGSSNVKILVNGRENRIGEGGNDVDNIPASMIEKVEVITSPSAKYDPEGMAGIINIILKKEKNEGFNGEVKIFSKMNDYHHFGEMGGLSVNLNYKKNKFNLYSSYSNSLRYRDHYGSREAYTTYTDSDLLLDDLESNIHFDWEREKKKKGQIFRFGSDYYLSDDITLNFEGRYNAYSSSEKSIESTILPELEVKEHEEAEPDGNYEIGISFSADKTYDNPDKNLSLSYSYDSHPVDKEFDIIVEDGHQDTTFISSTLVSQELKLSYTHPINKNSKFEMGYDFDQTNNDENMNYYLHVHRDEDEDEDHEDHEEPHISGLNTYGYNRDIHGGFLEYNAKLNDKWSIKPGIRFEYVNKNIQFVGTPEHWFCGSEEYNSYENCINACENDCELTDNPTDELGAYAAILEENNYTDLDDSYTSVYPSFHITYNITEKRSLQFAVSSRVERPGGGHHGGSRQIRPFPREVHSHHFIFLGNPELKPEYSTNYELSYKSPIPMGFFYTNLYYNQVRNKIEWYSSNEYADFDVLTFKNADKANSYGLEYFFMVMGQTIGGGFWYNDIQDGSDDSELNGINRGMNMYGSINLPEKYIKYFGFEFGFYYMKMADDYGSMFGDKGTIWANTGLTKSILNNRARISFNVDNIFNSGGFAMERTKPLIYGFDYIPSGYDGGEEYTNVSSSRNGRTYSITIKYNFGKLQKDKKRFRSSDSERGGGMDMGY